MRRAVAVALLVVAAGVTAGLAPGAGGPAVAAAQAGAGGAGGGQGGGVTAGEPGLRVFTPSPVVPAGGPAEVVVQVDNDGDLDLGPPENREVVTTARNVEMRVSSPDDSPIEVKSGRQAVGAIPENQPRSVPIRVEIPEDVAPGEYELDVRLRYSHTERYSPRAGVVSEADRTVTRTVEVEVEERPRFELRNATTEARVGDADGMTVEVANVGSEAATDVTVALESTSGQVSFGGSPRESAGTDRLAPGESAVVEYDIAVRPGASVREYLFDGTVQFEDPSGVAGVDREPSVRVVPLPEQTFAVGDVESTLRVGEDGELRGTVTNTGPATARSVVVQYADESASAIPIEREVAVGTLEPDESASFALPIELTDEAEPIRKTVNLAIRYRNADGERRGYADVDATATVREARDEFLLRADGTEVAADGEATIELRVENNLDEPVRNVEAKLFTDDPLDADDDEAFVGSLAPGESTTLAFRVSAAASATRRTYPVQLDFRYDDADGTSQVSDTYRIPVDVTAAEEGSGPPPSLVALVVGLVVVAAAGVAYWRRRGA